MLIRKENGNKIIVFSLLQHPFFDDRTGGDDADNIPLNEAFRQRRVLHLFADGHLVALLNKSVDVDVYRMIRHTAHRRTLRKPAVAPG